MQFPPEGGFSVAGTRFYTYGYRHAEVMDFIPSMPDASYRLHNFCCRERNRTPMRVSLGCHVLGAANPVPDITHSPSQVEGLIKRVATQMPVINQATLNRLKRYTVRFLKRNFAGKQFPYEENFDFDEYLEKTNYTLKRKQDLADVHKNPFNIDGKGYNVKGHTKDECYPEYKAFRGIHSRADDYKSRVGPFFQKLDKAIFSEPSFIKKIPVRHRAQWLSDKFRWARNFFMSDYSQFEATFGPALMQVELLIYKWFLDKNNRKNELIDLIRRGIMSTNHVKYKDFNFTIDCRRMSGEMNTSGGNGIMNLIISTFVLHELGNKGNLNRCVEGDDGAFEVDVYPTAADYALVGAVVKIDRPEVMNEGSFCGLIYDPSDGDNVTDVRESLLSFGWTTKQYMGASDFRLKALLRSKSLSMLYEYPACPILRNLALYGLRMTKEVPESYLKSVIAKQKLNRYESDLILSALDYASHPEVLVQEVKLATRTLVARKFGVSVELQLAIESYLDGLGQLQPLDIPGILPIVHKDCLDYYHRYGVELDRNELFHFKFNHTSNRRYRIWTRGPFVGHPNGLHYFL